MRQSRVTWIWSRNWPLPILPRLYPDSSATPRPSRPTSLGGATPGQGQAPSGWGPYPTLDLGPRPPQPPEMREGLGGKCLGVRGSKAWPYRNLNEHTPIATHRLQPRDFLFLLIQSKNRGQKVDKAQTKWKTKKRSIVCSKGGSSPAQAAYLRAGQV